MDKHKILILPYTAPETEIGVLCYTGLICQSGDLEGYGDEDYEWTGSNP